VFLHALGRSASDWLPVMEGMEPDWRCIAFDQRGHGDSVRPGEYNYELLEQDFREFVDSLGLDRFTLVAHSMGGVVGWIFAERTPNRLQALVIEDSVVPIQEHEYPEVPISPPEPVDYDWEVRRQLFRQLNSPDPTWWENVPAVTTPTLIIAGSESGELAETARILPRADLVTIDVGHWIHETVPDFFVDEIRSFLHRNSSPT
jgi:pimeloyl-ACP methyl ester carboxylesterase